MSALEDQVGGTHYKRLSYQPVELSLEIGATPTFCKVAKYLTRDKGDRLINLQKSIHCIKLEREIFNTKPFISQLYPYYADNRENVDRVMWFCRQFDNMGWYQRILIYMLQADYQLAIDEIEKFIDSGDSESI